MSRRSKITGAGVPQVRWWAGLGVMAIILMLSGVLAGEAAAAAPSWSLSSLANTTAVPGGQIAYLLDTTNVGDASTVGPIDPACNPVNPPVDPNCLIFTAVLPDGLTGLDVAPTSNGPAFSSGNCVGLGVPGPTTITCASSDVLPTVASDLPNSYRTFVLTVAVSPAATGLLTSSFKISGGGVAGATRATDPTTISASPPGFGIDAFDGQVGDSSGDAFTQAGGHPYAASTFIDFNTIQNANFFIGAAWPVEPTRDVLVDLPSGFVGNPTITERCTTPELAQENGAPMCSPASQVGTTVVSINGFGGPNLQGPLAVYNMSPPPGVPARFGFNLAGSVVTLDARLRSGSDYGLSVDVSNVPEGLPVAGTSLTFWGVPADPSHDVERSCAGQFPPWQGGATCATGTPRKAFLRNPTSCVVSADSPVSDGLFVGLHIDSWANAGRRKPDGSADLADPAWQSSSFVSHLPPAYPAPPSDWGAHQLPTGCEQVPFDPALTAVPGSPARTSSPAGFSFDVSLPQTDDPDAIAQSDLKRAIVTLPEGVRVSAASAGGLQACSPAQIGLDSTADSSCPDASKVGSLTITTPLLDAPLRGGIYLATPHDNKFGSLIAVYLVAKGPGLIVKIPGKVEPDGSSGQLKATFDDNPQLPFSNLHLEFKGGPRAPLATPNACGTYTTSSELSSWSGKTVVVKSPFTLDASSDGGSCKARGFAPTFDAGTQNPGAGKDSPFVLALTRGDQDQELRSLTVDMPTGLLGRIKNTTLCAEVAAAAGTCGDASKVGGVTVGAGAGSNPFFITNGRAYITGPYNGGPFGLSIVVPAVAGPFDLGNVVVRASIRVNRNTSALRVVSDPLPTSLEGIPLDVKVVRVLIDKPKFIVNPTSCAEKQVKGTVGSTEGAVAHVVSRFQVGECGALSLAPKMTLNVGSKGHTAVNKTTPFSTTLTQSPGQSNLRSVSVKLPLTLNARLGVVNQACTLVSFHAGHCTSKAKVGTAVAITPLLKDPLRGSAYFVKNPARALPDLMIGLRGQVSFDLVGKVTIPGGTQLATTFDAVPDVPLTKFTLKLVSGKNGPLGTTVNLCSAKARKATASVGFRGQNGKVLQTHTKLKINGCPKAKKAQKAKH